MTVANTPSRNQYIATSGQTVFPYSFEVIQAADIAVLKNGSTLSEGVDFTLTGVGNDNGGNVTLLVAASAGDIITIYRDMELSRANDYQDNGSFLASEVDADFDRLWLAMQQVYGASNRALRASDDDTVLTESNTILPAPGLRANKLIGFDATGAPSYNEIPALSGGFIVATNTENVVLTTAQTSVTFSGVTTSQTAYYVTGDNVDDARLLLGTDYTIASDTTITLLSTFPAGSIITAVQNEGAGEILSDVRTFDNVAVMKAANLTAGDTALCLRYYAGGDLVDGLLYEVKSSGTTDGYIDHDLANGNKAFLVTTSPISTSKTGASESSTAGDIAAIQAGFNFANEATSSDWSLKGKVVQVDPSNRIAIGSYQSAYTGIIQFNELDWPLNSNVEFSAGTREKVIHMNNIADNGTPVNEMTLAAPYHPALVFDYKTASSYAPFTQEAHALGSSTEGFQSIVFRVDGEGQFQFFNDSDRSTLQVKTFPPVAGGSLSRVWAIDAETGDTTIQANAPDTTDGAAALIGGSIKVSTKTGVALAEHALETEPRVYFQNNSARAYLAMDSLTNALNVKSLTQTAEGSVSFKIDEGVFFYNSTYSGLPATASAMKIGKNSTTNRSITASGDIAINNSVWSSGAGSPEGVVQASVGSMYTRTDGGAGSTLYVKESGTGNTGWVAK